MNLENAYRAQDIKQFIRYQYKLYELNGKFEEKCGGASLWSINEVSQDSFIIMGRNNLWIDKITGYMAERPSFIGVGVNHLFGEKGLISLLRIRGYKVKPRSVIAGKAGRRNDIPPQLFVVDEEHSAVYGYNDKYEDYLLYYKF